MNTIEYNEFLRSFSVRPNGSLDFFLGAGASVQAGIPSGWALIWEFKRTLYCQANKIKEEKFKDLESERNRNTIQSYFNLQSGYPALYSPEEYSFYFEKCHPNAMDRKFFMQRKILNIKPSIGHKCLGALYDAIKTNLLWTTNFDELVENGIKSVSNTLSIEVLSEDNKHQIDNLNQYPRVVKLHGDYRYDKLQNTTDELKGLQANLLDYFSKMSNSKGLIIVGYSGSDDSIMSALEKCLKNDNPFPYGLYWCIRKGQIPNERVAKVLADINILEEKLHKKKLSGFVEIEGFDEFLYDIYSICNLAHPEIENIARNLFEKRKPFSAPQANNNFTPIKLNGIKAKSFPNTAFGFESSIQGWKELREIVDGTELVAALSRGKTIVFGDVATIKNKFDGKIKTEITTVDFDAHLFSQKDSFFIGMLYELINHSLVKDYKLCSVGNKVNRKYYSAERKLNPNDDLKYINFPNGISKLNINIYEAFELQIEFFDKELYIVILPSVQFDDNSSLNKFQKQELVNKIISSRYNQKANEKLQQWIDYLKAKKTTLDFSLNNFKIELDDNLSFAGIVSDRFTSFKGAFKLAEPVLDFHSSDNNYSSIHPLKGLKQFGPLDYSFENKSINPSPIKIGIISPKSGLQKIVNHLNSLNASSNPSTEAEYLIEYPSFSSVYKRYLEIPNGADNKLCAIINDADIANLSQLQFYDHVKRAIDYFNGIRTEFDLLVLYFPASWQKFRELKNDEYYFDFHDSLKIYCAKKGIKIQFIEDKSISYADPSKVKWWLSLGMYVKAGGTPWKNRVSTDSTAFIGLSYAQKSLANRNNIVLGSSQIFDSSGQGLRFLLQPIDNPVFIGKNPFMSKEDARRLILKLKEAYFRMDSNAKLEKLVIHKTTHFTRAEMDGIAQALDGITNVELLQIQFTNWRGIRGDIAKKLPHGFPIERGTVIQLDDYSFLLWTHGTVIHNEIENGRKNYYQGKRGIPAPLLIKRFRGQDSIETTVKEVLSLTKMNWNGGELYKTLPVTLDFSKKLSKMAKQTESLQAIPYDFRFFM